jgi:deoxyribodipyrimidine photo-lyase
METRKGIVWFRSDLRLHDNEALTEALQQCSEVIPVYVFDPRVFAGTTSLGGFPKTGQFRLQFILESVADLRDSLRKRGSDLLVRVGKPEEEIFKIAKAQKTSWVFCNRERTWEEMKVQDALEKNLWSVGQEMSYSRGKLLYYTADLPFPINQTPEVFTQFRKEVERIVPVRQPIAAPEEFPALDPGVNPGDLPLPAEFSLESPSPDERAGLVFKGGETEGLKRLKYYLWETDLAQTYFDTRNGLLGGDYSTKFSPWLAQGCLSPKYIYQELKRYEQERGENKSTYWIFFELLWRDYFRLMAKKHGNAMFMKGGMRGKPDRRLSDDFNRLKQWADGETGVPFIDANMREIACTGFMSNRGRQNVASYLVHDLKVNWQLGAEYFESLLIDYDVASNWGNWNYIAGVGNDPREDRYFNPKTQASRYDPQGDYVRHWLADKRSGVLI